MTRELLSERDQERFLELSWALAGVRSVEGLAAAAVEGMQRIIGAEGVSFQQADLRRAQNRVISYFSGDWLPSDVVSAWDKWATNLQSPIYAEVLRGRSTPFTLSSIIPVDELPAFDFYELYREWGVRYQAIVPIQGNPETLVGMGYALNRCSEDFSSQDMSRVYALQAVLTAHHAALQVRPRLELRTDAVPGISRLTQREQQVLSLVASGMTAVAIGHALRISPGTVRKHVENSYSKLGVHDRLEAISRCRAAGLVA